MLDRVMWAVIHVDGEWLTMFARESQAVAFAFGTGGRVARVRVQEVADAS